MGLADTGSLESDCGARCTHIGEVPGPALIRPDEQQAPVPRARHLATMPHTGSLTALAGAQMRRHFILQYVAREVPADVPDTLRSLAQAARDLIQGRRTHHPELLLFTSWPTLREYAEHDPTASGLQPFANLVDEHGPDAILQAVEQLAPESTAQVTVSTVHKAKGREWSHVRITPDFPHRPKPTFWTRRDARFQDPSTGPKPAWLMSLSHAPAATSIPQAWPGSTTTRTTPVALADVPRGDLRRRFLPTVFAFTGGVGRRLRGVAGLFMWERPCGRGARAELGPAGNEDQRPSSGGDLEPARSGLPFQPRGGSPPGAEAEPLWQWSQAKRLRSGGRVPVWPTAWLERSIRGAGQYGDQARRKNDSGAPPWIRLPALLAVSSAELQVAYGTGFSP